MLEAGAPGRDIVSAVGTASTAWARYGWIAQLVPICLLALALRTPGMRAQLPDQYWHDELNLVEGALRVGAGEIVGASYGGYSHGTLTYYVLFAALALYFAAGRVTGQFGNADDFLMAYVADPSSTFLVARSVMLMMNLISVVLTFVLARRLFGNRAGLVAAVLLAVSFQSVQITLGKEDGLFTALVLAAVTYAIVTVDRPVRRHRFAVLGALIGAATAVKYFGVLATSVVLVTARQAGGGRRTWPEVTRDVAVAALTFAVAFLSLVPGVLLDTRRFAFSFSKLAAINTGTLFSDVAVAVSPWHGYLWKTFATANGPVLAVLFYAASVWLLRHRFRYASMLLVYPALLTAVLTAVLLFGRPAEATNFYQLSTLPLLCVAVGGLLNHLWTSHGAVVRAAVAAAVAVMIATNVVDDIRFERLLRAPDSRTVTRRWIEQHVAPSSTILVEGAIYTFILEGPQLAETANSLTRSLSQIRQQGGGGRLWAAKLRAAEQPGGPARFDVRKVRDVTTDSLDQRPAFVVVRNERSRQLVESDGRYRQVFAVEPDSPMAFQFVPLLSSADIARLRRIPILAADPGVMPGPAIHVYAFAAGAPRAGYGS